MAKLTERFIRNKINYHLLRHEFDVFYLDLAEMFEKIKEGILSNRIFHPLEVFALSILAPKLSVLS